MDLEGGGTTPGREVNLPWGPAAGQASVWGLVPEAQGVGWLLEAREVWKEGSKSYLCSSEYST